MADTQYTTAAKHWLEGKDDGCTLAFIVLAAQMLQQLNLLTDIDRQRVARALDEAGFLQKAA